MTTSQTQSIQTTDRRRRGLLKAGAFAFGVAASSPRNESIAGAAGAETTPLRLRFLRQPGRRCNRRGAAAIGRHGGSAEINAAGGVLGKQ